MACRVCQKTDLKLLVCQACREAKYCSRICQTQDWSRHKPTCLAFRRDRIKEILLKNFSLTDKDLLSRLIYEQMTQRIQPKSGPIPETISFISIFLIGPSPDQIEQQILKVYEIAVDLFQKCIIDDLKNQGKLDLLSKPEQVPLVLVEFFGEKVIDERRSEFSHSAGLTLYPYQDQKLADKIRPDLLDPLKEAVEKSLQEQRRSWSSLVDFTFPFLINEKTERYLAILDQLKVIQYDSKLILDF